ncbi:MAG: hypothetical protein VX073_01730 [Pseudomonadota bacterium]|nr:hypothetical protein [Pseudomonadota bacterium]
MTKACLAHMALICSCLGLLALAGPDPADGVNALGTALGEAMGVFAGELAGTL